MVVWDVRSAWIVLWNHGGTMVEPWRRRRWRAQSKFWIKIARLRGRPEGLKSETEHVSECVWEALASAVQSVCVCVSVSSCSFFFICQLCCVCRRSHWQLRAAWNKAPVGIMHGAPSVPQKTIPEQMENAGKRGAFGSNGWFWIWKTKHMMPNFCLPLSAMKLITGTAATLLWHRRLWHSRWRARLAASYTVAMVAIGILLSSPEKQTRGEAHTLIILMSHFR